MHSQQLKESELRVIRQCQSEIVVNFQTLLNGQQNCIDCLIVLNCKKQHGLLAKLVNAASNIVIADGGANTFYQSECRNSSKLRSIVGDLDSINPDTKSYYQNRGIKICYVEDQNYNDFQKSITYARCGGFKNIVCLGALGGRIDHTISSLHLSSKIIKQNVDTNLILIGDGNLMMCLKPKIDYRLRISNSMQSKTGNGLITFSKAENIETTGFKWNLGAKQWLSSLEWGKFESTSNQILDKQVTVRSDNELFFVCSFKNE